MATIKSYTDLEQSRKLEEILPLESADMYWYLATKDNPKARFNEGYNEYGDFELPCWSLAALFAFLPKSAFLERGNVTELYRITLPIELVSFDWFVEPIDACVAMIEKLHELNLL